jgi:hypothetical protein
MIRNPWFTTSFWRLFDIDFFKRLTKISLDNRLIVVQMNKVLYTFFVAFYGGIILETFTLVFIPGIINGKNKGKLGSIRMEGRL